jgi:hypothetical protein
MVDSIKFDGISHNRGVLKWNEPRKPNGIIEFYFIAYAKIKDVHYLPFSSNTDPCHFEIESYTSLNNQPEPKYSPSLITDLPTSNSINNNAKYASKKISADQKLDLISIEDEIYNMAFRQSIKLSKTKLTSQVVQKPSKTNYSLLNSTKTVQNTTHGALSPQNINLLDKLHNFEYITPFLLRIIQSDLMIADQVANFITLKLSNYNKSAYLANLDSFGRYMVSVSLRF